MLAFLGSAAFLITYFAMETHRDAEARAEVFYREKFEKQKIKGGNSSAEDPQEIIDDNGVIGNPKKYPESSTLCCCVMP